jgi:hypothetical protein
MPSGAERFPTFNPALATIIGIGDITDHLPPFMGPIALVATSFATTFIRGQYVKFLIPAEYGMIQLNGRTGLILFVSNDPASFVVNIDVTNMDPFAVPAAPLQSAQAIPTGELATLFYGATVNIKSPLPPFPPYPNPSSPA